MRFLSNTKSEQTIATIAILQFCNFANTDYWKLGVGRLSRGGHGSANISDAASSLEEKIIPLLLVDCIQDEE